MAAEAETIHSKASPFHPAYYILGILLIIQIRGDGYFPFPKTWPQDRLITIVLVHTLALVTLVGLSTYWLLANRQIQAKPHHLTPVIAYGLIPVAAIIGIHTLHSLQSTYFSNVGYRSDGSILLITSLLGALPFVVYWLRVWKNKGHSAVFFLVCVLSSTLIMKSLPINLFPITAKRSDLLPILKKSSLSLYSGENPHRNYLLDNGINTPNVRFPGMILAYLPASITNNDLRLVTLIFEILIFIILILKIRTKSGKEKEPMSIQWHVMIPLICFMLLPYWHYRHELYEPPFWLILLLTFIAFDRGHTLGFALGLGTMGLTHHWGVLFGPFLFMGFFRKKGAKPTILALLIAFIWCAAGYILLVNGYIKDFFQQAFRTYDHFDTLMYFYPMSMYFSHLLVKFNLLKLLLPLKVMAQVPLLYLAWRYGKDTASLAGILALSLTLFLMFNPVAWTYQYLLVVFLLILGWMFHSFQPASPSPT